MAKTVSEGLQSIANADLTKLKKDIAEVIAGAKLDVASATATAKSTLQEFLDALEAAQKGR